MARYLEYDQTSGRILSEVVSESPPEPTAGYGLLEIDADMNLDTSCYAVRDGALVKLYETNTERLERERLRKEHHEHVRHRVKSMMFEVCIAILDDNEEALKELRREYKTLKAYM